MSGKDTGLGHWVRLRMSAVALIPLTFWIIYSVLELKDLPYGEFVFWLQNPYNAGMLIVFLLASYYHAVLGVQEIYEDYITCEKNRTCAIWATRLVFVGLTVASIVSIASIAF
jgi:succinate dehydrogenase / fumarate reductase, membrane anchor subunit